MANALKAAAARTPAQRAAVDGGPLMRLMGRVVRTDLPDHEYPELAAAVEAHSAGLLLGYGHRRFTLKVLHATVSPCGHCRLADSASRSPVLVQRSMGHVVYRGAARFRPRKSRRWLGRPRAVPHGFRSSFRDWASECTDAPHAVMEAALAHAVRNQAEAAYARSDLFARRRELMDAWAAYIS